jgi:hypothetical protein
MSKRKYRREGAVGSFAVVGAADHLGRGKRSEQCWLDKNGSK